MNQHMLKIWLLTVCFFSLAAPIKAQNTGYLSGQVIDKNTQQPIVGASILLLPLKKGMVTGNNGEFRLGGIVAGSYSLEVGLLNYTTVTINNLIVTSGNENLVTVELEPKPTSLTNVVVKGRRNNVRAASLETPLSVQRLTIEEIKANPGGNFDISKVIQSLPGVGGGVGGGGFRNDIVIRGGAPSENVFYLDGIEVPIINHFSTQGSGGGPQGILNVSFIEDVKLSTSAFDARYDNTLSSVFQFKQKNGNPNRLQGNIRLSATELAATLDGPLSKKTTFLASARRSYLQLLFKALDLPIRPNYWDFQLKVTHKINEKTTFSLLGIGAIDEFTFAAPKTATPEKLYLINSSAAVNQWSYTIGANVKKLVRNGYWNLALSRNTLDNTADRYENNRAPSPTTQTLLTESRETENKLRFDMNLSKNGWKISYGASAQIVEFNNNFFARFRKQLLDANGNVEQPGIELVSVTGANFVRYGLFAQFSRRYLKDRLALSAGVRLDANSLKNSESNLFKQFSPRISASYALSDKWNLNASWGRYFKLPSYTQLAYVNALLSSININPGDYIRSTHTVAGLEFLPSNATRFTLEGFYKQYANYPISQLEGISLANKGTDFGSIGNEPIVQSGKGKAYGIEFFAQQKLTKRFFGLLSYTWYVSEFTNLAGKYLPAAWDNRHLLSITWGYKFNKNWELGLKFRYQGAAPYSPFDEVASRANYLSQGNGIINYNAFNTLRLKSFNASDVRIDKKWNYKKVTLDIFLDVQNWYIAKNPGLPNYTFRRNADNTAFLTTDGLPIKNNGSNAIPYLLKNDDPSVQPTFGCIVEF